MPCAVSTHFLTALENIKVGSPCTGFCIPVSWTFWTASGHNMRQSAASPAPFVGNMPCPVTTGLFERSQNMWGPWIMKWRLPLSRVGTSYKDVKTVCFDEICKCCWEVGNIAYILETRSISLQQWETKFVKCVRILRLPTIIQPITRTCSAK